jgi:hypothetical protein
VAPAADASLSPTGDDVPSGTILNRTVRFLAVRMLAQRRVWLDMRMTLRCRSQAVSRANPAPCAAALSTSATSLRRSLLFLLFFVIACDVHPEFDVQLFVRWYSKCPQLRCLHGYHKRFSASHVRLNARRANSRKSIMQQCLSARRVAAAYLCSITVKALSLC